MLLIVSVRNSFLNSLMIICVSVPSTRTTSSCCWRGLTMWRACVVRGRIRWRRWRSDRRGPFRLWRQNPLRRHGARPAPTGNWSHRNDARARNAWTPTPNGKCVVWTTDGPPRCVPDGPIRRETSNPIRKSESGSDVQFWFRLYFWILDQIALQSYILDRIGMYSCILDLIGMHSCILDRFEMHSCFLNRIRMYSCILDESNWLILYVHFSALHLIQWSALLLRLCWRSIH